MSDTKISALPDGGAVQSTDEFVAARAGTNVKIAGSEMGGGGGSGSVLTATLTLDNDGILALASTPAVVVPATTVMNYDPSITPDVIYRPIAATAITNIVTPYGVGGSDPHLLLAYSSDWANDASSKSAMTNGLVAAGTWQIDLPCPSSVVPEFPALFVLGAGGQPVNGDWLDNALSLALANATLGSGGPGNSLSLTVLYMALATT